MSWLPLLAALLAAVAPAAVTAGADASTSPIKCTLTVNGSESLLVPGSPLAKGTGERPCAVTEPPGCAAACGVMC